MPGPAAGPPGQADRYGRADQRSRARSRRRLSAAVAVLLAGGVGYAVWFGVASDDQATARSQGYRVIDDTQVEITFTVSKPRERTADCQVEALSSGAAQVGLVTVPVGPASTAATTVRATLPTSERAVTAQPVECTLR